VYPGDVERGGGIYLDGVSGEQNRYWWFVHYYSPAIKDYFPILI